MGPVYLSVDEKGRLQIPKKIRERAGIARKVKAQVTEKGILIEPSEDPLERLSGMVEFGFRSVRDTMPSLRKAAERQLASEG
ncbi:MAG: AbrB/MazE/SpoVT family DNA-binding domain-containing protein [Nitrososphaerales archaeon]|nr:AbrB/MazE/SpoVT family DNA-binding domain-containing protein [Nitrososphaerales archaeon]